MIIAPERFNPDDYDLTTKLGRDLCDIDRLKIMAVGKQRSPNLHGNFSTEQNLLVDNTLCEVIAKAFNCTRVDVERKLLSQHKVSRAERIKLELGYLNDELNELGL